MFPWVSQGRRGSHVLVLVLEAESHSGYCLILASNSLELNFWLCQQLVGKPV